MANIVDNMIRAAKLEPGFYNEIAQNEDSMGAAVTVVVIVSAAAGIGAALAGPAGLIGGAVMALLGWVLQAALAYVVGTKLIPDPDTRCDLTAVLRVTGFATAPGVLAVVGIVPGFGWLVGVVASLWQLAAFVVAIRVVMNFDGNGKAIMVVIIGWIVKGAVAGLFVLLGLTGALMLAF
ncbi:MAG: hypothetical protein GY780_11365 [bacterium]|nr:hypothetical protein [bacterium]